MPGRPPADFVLRLSGAERLLSRTLEQRQRAFAGGYDETGQLFRELIDGADVIDVSVGKQNTTDRCTE